MRTQDEASPRGSVTPAATVPAVGEAARPGAATAAGAAASASPFDRVLDRRGTNSMKWDGQSMMLAPHHAAADPLPMWVADMDFRSPQPVIDALHDAVETGVFGYPAGGTRAYVQSVIDWQGRRYGWEVEGEWIVQMPGILAALRTAVQAYSAPGDSVLIQTPVYAHFQDDVRINGRDVVSAPLTRAGDRYAFDAAVFEAAIRPNTKLFILSNPHNPTGNVWSEADLRAMGEICARHGVLVFADEIHQDLVLDPGKRHVPFASLGPEFAANSITGTAPSKTFNLPGLQSANVIVPDARLRGELQRQYDRNQFPVPNTLGMIAAEAAYSHGEPWLDEMLTYVRGNQEHFARTVNDTLPQLRVLPADSLYLAWMDCRGLGMDIDGLDDFLLTRARLWFDRGPKFGAEGHGYMRVNLACPRATVDEALTRLTDAVTGL